MGGAMNLLKVLIIVSLFLFSSRGPSDLVYVVMATLAPDHRGILRTAPAAPPSPP